MSGAYQAGTRFAGRAGSQEGRVTPGPLQGHLAGARRSREFRTFENLLQGQPIALGSPPLRIRA